MISRSRISGRSFPWFATAMVALGMLLLSCQKPMVAPPPATGTPTTWTITAHIEKNLRKPKSYSVVADPIASAGGCTYATSASSDYPPSGLKVCPGDIIRWVGDSPDGNQHALAIFMADQVLSDDSSNPKTLFVASNGNLTDKGHVTTNPQQFGDHEWYITLFDTRNSEIHSEDPKIIIGK